MNATFFHFLRHVAMQIYQILLLRFEILAKYGKIKLNYPNFGHFHHNLSLLNDNLKCQPYTLDLEMKRKHPASKIPCSVACLKYEKLKLSNGNATLIHYTVYFLLRK
jgi:hypothetical protein